MKNHRHDTFKRLGWSRTFSPGDPKGDRRVKDQNPPNSNDCPHCGGWTVRDPDNHALRKCRLCARRLERVNGQLRVFVPAFPQIADDPSAGDAEVIAPPVE